MPGEVHETVLPCGLTVRLMEMHTAPITSHWVWYRVGSRDEPVGKSGLSHWVEHMQFKGSPRFPAAQLDRAIARLGGSWNAFTYLDWTAYYETLPAADIDIALELEADRMRGVQYRHEDVDSERKVILAEREGSENEPLFRLGEAVQAACFPHHPYRNEVIGLRQDLLSHTRQDLQDWYDTHYQPANAILCLAGDFAIQPMLERIAAQYQEFVPGALPNRAQYEDRRLENEVRVEIRGAGQTTYLQICYRAPAAAAPQFAALTVLDSLLSGPASLNMFGGGSVSNRTSRLYRALVEQELAVGVTGGLQATLDPYVLDTILTLHPEAEPARALAVFDREIARLQQEPVSAEELRRAVKQARALFAYGTENITNQAFWLGFAPMFADYSWFTGYLERLEAVTPADLQAAACQWLNPEQRVVGIYIPDGKPLAEVEE